MKRLTSKLDELERQARTDGELSTAAKIFLVQILARRDALFVPWRWQTGSQVPMCEIKIRQREYLAGAVGISAKADGKTNWKTAHELRQDLIVRGFLTATQSSGQITSLFLTPTGEATARALVGERLSNPAEADVALAILQVKIERYGSPIRESTLFPHPCTGDPGGWEHFEELLLPLLTAGVVRANSDTQGRILYALTGAELPEAVQVDVEANADKFDPIYMKAWKAERAFLASVEPRDPAECFIPVGASCCWPEVKEDVPDEK